MANLMVDDTIDEDHILDPRYNFTPVRALRPSCRTKIAQFLDLDGTMVVVSDNDYVNNFNGLAELIGFGYNEIRNFANKRSPTQELLEHWTTTPQGQEATVGNLWSYLYQLERFDVLTDCRRNILTDCRVFEEQLIYEREAEAYRIEKQIEQDPRVSNSDMKVDETKYATVQDAQTGEMTIYDAFICYEIEDAGDREFVRKLIRKLEVEPESERKLKLFVPGRDDLPGAAQHVINAYLIEKRCRRMIIVMSNAFHNSQACDFQTKFAHCLAPGARSKRLIPVIKDKGVPLTRILRFLAVCDFTKSDMEDWVWERLYTAVVAPMPMITDPNHIHSETANIDELMNTPYPVSSCLRLDTADKISVSSRDSGIAGSVSSYDPQEQMEVSQRWNIQQPNVHAQRPRRSPQPGRSQIGQQAMASGYLEFERSATPPPGDQADSPKPKTKKSGLRFPSFFKKKKQENKPKVQNDGTQSMMVRGRESHIPYSATRDRHSMIVRPSEHSMQASCGRPINSEQVVLDIENKTAIHTTESMNSARLNREGHQGSQTETREPIQHLDLEKRAESESLKPGQAYTSWGYETSDYKGDGDNDKSKVNRHSTDSNEVSSTSNGVV